MIQLVLVAIFLFLLSALTLIMMLRKGGREVNWEKEYGKGAWALVTGSTEGIGKEIAFQLSKRGFNIILMARNEDKLKKTRKEILSSLTSKGSIKVKTIVFDFSSSSRDLLVDSLSGLDRISILVNNVGVSHEHPKFFIEEDMDSLESIINVNILNTVRLTKIVLHGMMERDDGSKASIINIGSFSGECPIPLLQTYSASKAFLKTWSISLGKELEDKGITCHLFNTYFVVSNMSKIKRHSFLVPTPKDYVSSLLRIVGQKGSFFSTPFLSHAILSMLMNLIPSSLLLSLNYSNMLSTRLKALKRRVKS